MFEKSDAVAVVFPAFGMKYTGNEDSVLTENNINLDHYLKKAGQVVNIEAQNAETKLEGCIENELQAQYMCYIYSCIFSNLLRSRSNKLQYAAGNSMGLYSCLYHCGAVDFEQGLLLIKNAYDIVLNTIENTDFTMASIVGLKLKDLKRLLKAVHRNVEIININSELSCIICGERTGVDKIIEAALNEGALKCSVLPINCCYHTKYALKAGHLFKQYVSQCDIKDPVYQIVSAVNQKVVKTGKDIKKELVSNLMNHLDWHQTMKKLLKQNVRVFVECGPGNTLSRIAKFISGDYSMLTTSQFLKQSVK